MKFPPLCWLYKPAGPLPSAVRGSPLSTDGRSNSSNSWTGSPPSEDMDLLAEFPVVALNHVDINPVLLWYIYSICPCMHEYKIVCREIKIIYIYNIHTMYVPFQLPSKMHIQFPPVRCSRLIWGTLNDQAPSDDSFLFWDHQLISCLKSALLGLCNELPSDKQTVCELEAMAHLVWWFTMIYLSYLLRMVRFNSFLYIYWRVIDGPVIYIDATLNCSLGPSCHALEGFAIWVMRLGWETEYYKLHVFLCLEYDLACSLMSIGEKESKE